MTLNTCFTCQEKFNAVEETDVLCLKCMEDVPTIENPEEVVLFVFMLMLVAFHAGSV